VGQDQPIPARLSASPHQPGFVVWFTGLPASGKSTLARAVKRRLAERGIHAVYLDSDALRPVLTPRPAYTEEERDWFYQVLAFLAAWLAGSGVNVLVAATAHKRAYREQARGQIARFAEAYVQCPLHICEQRDPKGIYQLARSGSAGQVPGVGVPYEPPQRPEAVVDCARLTPDEAAADILTQLAGQLLAPIGR
jgi:adenylylsulfate kinase